MVKICPNCSAENKPDSEKCAKCDWSLAEVQASESKAAGAVSSAVGATPMPSSAPARQRSGAGVIVLIVVIIAGAAFAAWWFLLRGGGGPEATVKAFFSAAKAGNIEGLKASVTKESASFFSMGPGGEQATAERMKKDMATENPKTVKTSYEGENAIVAVEGGKTPLPGPMEFVLIKEDGKWKIDFRTTGMREIKKMQEKFGGKMPQMPSDTPAP